jgi:uncharacterized membrane-anchored protein
MRRVLAILAGVLVLAVANVSVWNLEELRTGGRVVLLELAPVDPRALMQGDYMALRFAVERDAFGPGPPSGTRGGRIVVRLDPRGVGTFVRIDDGRPLAEGEVALRYRVRGGRVKFATNAFFFQEGHAARYDSARYGELRVADSGELLLTHLRGRRLERLP